MNLPLESKIIVERVDDIPVLLAHLEQMGVPGLLDEHFPTHGNWQGLSLGWTATIWLVHILSQADHRLNRVQDWVAQHGETLHRCTGQVVEELDFTDDRLGAVLRYLNEDRAWERYEQNQGQCLLRVYELATATVRLDTTTASTYQAECLEGLFRRGVSKDHRPDLAQVKAMLATLDPLGLPLATTVVDGSRADDPLYEPAIAQVRATLQRTGVLYIGDSKMGAQSTRAGLAAHKDYYLVPLSATQLPEAELEAYLQPVWEGRQPLTQVERTGADGKTAQIAEGYESELTLRVDDNGQTVVWVERRLIVRSLNHAAAQEAALHERLEQAQAALEALSCRRRGKKRLRSLAEYQQAIEAILTRYRVADLLDVQCTETLIERPRRRYGERRARGEHETQIDLTVTVVQPAVDALIRRLGWRVYATNAPTEALGLPQAVLAYREQYIVERGFARLKGQPLSLTPMYLQREDHVTGLIRLLSIALRALTLFEFVIRRRLAGTRLAGLYPGNRTRTTARPSAELLLEAFNGIDLIRLSTEHGPARHLTPLSKVQQNILALLGLSPVTYTRLAGDFSEPGKK
jgi:transposase